MCRTPTDPHKTCCNDFFFPAWMPLRVRLWSWPPGRSHSPGRVASAVTDDTREDEAGRGVHRRAFEPLDTFLEIGIFVG